MNREQRGKMGGPVKLDDKVADDIRRRVLEKNFVTSATDPIYAIRAECPPEVFGAFGSYFSRSPRDFRDNLLLAITGNIQGHELEHEEVRENLIRLDQGYYKSPAEALKFGISKAQDFFRRWYGRYSHKSIANTVWIPFVATNVSQLFARQLAFDQLAFFIEQSTRFVKFDVANLYLDKDVMGSKHADLFVGTMRSAAEAYEKFTELAADHYGRELSFEQWLAVQDDRIRSDKEDAQRIKYRRELKAKAFDVARLLLPQAVRTNIAWILDARSTEFDIAAWKGHPLREIREDAELIEKAGGEIAPSLLKYTEMNLYYKDQYSSFDGDLEVRLDPSKIEKGVDVISYDPDALDKTVAMLLLRVNRSGDFKGYYAHAKLLNFERKMEILNRVTEKRGERDEWVDVEEAFDSIGITVQIRTDVGATRDLRRHQKWDRNEGRYTLDNGFYEPEIIKEIGEEATRVYREVMERAYDAEVIIRRDFPDAVQYLVPMAAFHVLTMRSGLDQFQYLVATRTTPQGHFSYRQDAYNLAEAVCKVHPWLLGLKEYPKGRTVQDVIKDVPLKGILKPYLGDTGLHT